MSTASVRGVVARTQGEPVEVTKVVVPDPGPGEARVTATSLAAGLTVLIPLAYLFRSPGIVRPRRDPLRYRIPLYDVSPEELQLALVPLVPPNLPIAVRPRWRTRALRRMRRSRLATAA